MNGEAQIWNRVFAQPRQQAMGEQLYALARLSTQALKDYRALGNKSRRMALAAEWEGENLECLRGMFLLETGREPRILPETSGSCRGREGECLYRRAMEQMQTYTALSAQPGYGVAFGEMARRQAKICEGILGFLGEEKQKTIKNVRR